MPTVAQRIFEDPISHSQDEAPLDAYSRAVAAGTRAQAIAFHHAALIKGWG